MPPDSSVRIFFSSRSRQSTSLPTSAKHAPVTRPTYPVPTIEIFKSSLPISGCLVEFLGPSRRVGLPSAARGAVPVELARLEPAILAPIPRKAPGLAVDEIAYLLEVVAPLYRRDQELRLEQLVQAQEGLAALELVLHQLVRRVRALGVERRLESDVEQVERREAGQVPPQQRQPLRGAAQDTVALQQPLRDQRQVLRVLLLDALPGLDRALVVARAREQVAEDDVGAHAFAVRGDRRFPVAPGAVPPRVRRLRHRELAVVVGDLLLRRLPGVALELLRHVDRLDPVLLLLVDLEQGLERRGAMRRALQLHEHLLGAVEQPRLEVVLAELDHRVQPLLLGEVGPLEEVLVHADRPLGLAAAAERAPQREVQLDRLRIDLDDLDEGLDRLVGLLVQEEVQPPEVGARQAPGLGEKLLDVDARGEPAQPEEQGEPEQPPELEVEVEVHDAPRLAAARCARRAGRGRASGSRAAARAGATGRRVSRSPRRAQRTPAAPGSSGAPRSVRGRSAGSPARC